MLRIGIIGFGGAGQAHYFYFSCVAGCRVTKIFDPKPAARDRAVWRGAGDIFCDDENRFWPDLDAVVVCTPDSTHASYIVAALERGLHVLVEKPLTDSIEGLQAIRRAADAASGQVAAVVHQMRFVPLHRRIKSLISAGTLGPLSYLEGYYVHDLTERAFANDRWREEQNATPLVYSGCHFVDLLRWLAGEEIVEVFAAAGHRAFPEYPESDLNLVTLRFASGAIGKVVVEFGEPGPQDHTVRVSGRQASVRGNLLYRRDGRLGEVLHRPMIFQPALLRGAGKTGGQSRYRQLRTNLPPYLMARTVEMLRLLARRPDAEYGAANYPVRLYEHSLACVGAIEDFVAAIRDRRQPLCSVDEAGRTVLACLAGVESYRTNRPVTVRSLDA
ncbi:MAG TPA: Gfo/Idh/MocA family oxidoreductase [Vicinamibacterales bacterium]|jgi:predicted dehydrogenase|nr:Gfo/Idh/MocA family oxidoreductase [Vicinamibacterales bacterium]